MQSSKSQRISETVENAIDIILNFSSLIMAYLVAFLFAVNPMNLYEPFEPEYILMSEPRTFIVAFVIVIVQSLFFMSFNLYRPIPFVKSYKVLSSIVKVNLAMFFIGLLVTFFAFSGKDFVFSVVWMIFSAIISTAVLLYKKRMMIRIAKFFRKSRYKLRKVIIVGDNTASAKEFLKNVSMDTGSGMMVVGYVGDRIDLKGGCEKLGSFRDLARVLDEYNPTEVVFAMDSYNKKKTIELVNLCDDRCVKVYFLPVMYGFFKSAKQLESVGTLPIINVHSTPLDYKLNAFIKRVVDIVFSLILIVATSPIMLATAVGVALSSPGPIFFKQERVGKMGKTFKMLKFRSMKVNVQSDVAWTTGEDPRKTKFGAFIRKVGIDELPQLFNILKGDMSLVGPRPEVPHFVKHFREIIPLYMVKHYVKPGLTGYAQIQGLRGDTSIEDRIHADIEYIENWSLGMDLYIMLMTPFKMINKSEKYVDESEEAELPETEDEMEEEARANAAFSDGEYEVQNENGTSDELKSDAPVKEGKKILYAASVMSHINNFHLQYIESLRNDGYTVKVMARGDGADFNVPFEKKFFSASNRACREEIKKIIANEHFDIIVLNTSLASFHIRYALPKEKENRPRVVNIVHGYLFSEHTNVVKRCVLSCVEKLVAKRTDAIIVMNEADRKIAEKYKLCNERVFVSRGMGAKVRPPISNPEDIRRELMCEDKFVLAFVGELSARKNQAFLINALARIEEKVPNVVLWLVGDGLERDRLKSLAGEVDISSSVFFLGQREDACDIMRACDLYVSASTIEGMPFNIIEAMGCGKTILASDIKGHNDLIEEGKTGFLFKYGRMDEFVEKAVAIERGELSVSSADVVEKYKKYANENVFLETYGIMKESFKDESC